MPIHGVLLKNNIIECTKCHLNSITQSVFVFSIQCTHEYYDTLFVSHSMMFGQPWIPSEEDDQLPGRGPGRDDGWVNGERRDGAGVDAAAIRID